MANRSEIGSYDTARELRAKELDLIDNFFGQSGPLTIMSENESRPSWSSAEFTGGSRRRAYCADSFPFLPVAAGQTFATTQDRRRTSHRESTALNRA